MGQQHWNDVKEYVLKDINEVKEDVKNLSDKFDVFREDFIRSETERKTRTKVFAVVLSIASSCLGVLSTVFFGKGG